MDGWVNGHMEIEPYFLMKPIKCMKKIKIKRFSNPNENKVGLVPNPYQKKKNTCTKEKFNKILL
jgi:hypothetical protein